MTEPGKTYSREQVIEAVNEAISLIEDDSRIYLDPAKSTLLDLAANGAITLLEQPGRTLNEIIQANWQPATENEDVVEKVLEWLE